jgi:pimeloyl-ACP methyl ester carboxylesterase
MNGMQKAREAWHTTDLKRRLERHHRDVDAVFEAFITPWGLREFGDADFRKRLGQIRCPTLILQGDRDEYGTTKQASMVSDLVPDATVVILEDCGHTPHRERADVVVEQVSRFLARSADASAGHE